MFINKSTFAKFLFGLLLVAAMATFSVRDLVWSCRIHMIWNDIGYNSLIACTVSLVLRLVVRLCIINCVCMVRSFFFFFGAAVHTYCSVPVCTMLVRGVTGMTYLDDVVDFLYSTGSPDMGVHKDRRQGSMKWITRRRRQHGRMKKTTGKTKNEDRIVLCCHQRNNEGRREGRIICRLVCAPSCVYGPKKKGRSTYRHRNRIASSWEWGWERGTCPIAYYYSTERNKETRSVRGPHPHHARIESNKERSTQYTTTNKEDKQTPKRRRRTTKNDWSINSIENYFYIGHIL